MQKKPIFKGGICCVGLLFMSALQAVFFEERSQGWHWYQDPLIALFEAESPSSERTSSDEGAPLEPSVIIQSYRKELEQRLHRAWVYPSMQNIKAYQLMQKDLMQRSQNFAHTWMQVVYQNPSLDHSLVFPMGHQARHVYLDQQKANVRTTIQSLREDYGLFFFFSSQCAYCHQFAPIVKAFSKEHGWAVLAISTDGGTLAEFPEALPDQGLMQKWKVEFVPALFAVNPKTGEILPLAYGLTALDQIEERLIALLKAPNRVRAS